MTCFAAGLPAYTVRSNINSVATHAHFQVEAGMRRSFSGQFVATKQLFHPFSKDLLFVRNPL